MGGDRAAIVSDFADSGGSSKRPTSASPEPPITLRTLVDDDTIVANERGSQHIWNARHFFEIPAKGKSESDPARLAEMVKQVGKEL